jgi:hypothetical protein
MAAINSSAEEERAGGSGPSGGLGEAGGVNESKIPGRLNAAVTVKGPRPPSRSGS